MKRVVWVVAAWAGLTAALPLPARDTEPRVKLDGHAREVASVAFSPDGKTLASGSWDSTIKLWEVATGRNTATLKGHSSYVSCVAFRPDGKTLASASWDSTVKLWDVATGKETATLQGHRGAVWSIADSTPRRCCHWSCT